jgi:diguanylate cyclase
MIATGTFEAQARKEIQDARARTALALKELERIPGQHAAFDRVRESFGAYQVAVDEEFRLLDAGQLEAAHEVDETKVDPSFEELSAVLETASGEYATAADRAGWLADASSVATMLLATLVIAALSRRAERVHQAMVRLEAQHAETQEREERDPLTGLLNRRGLQRYRAALPAEMPAALLMIDLNDLKIINDRDPQAMASPVARSRKERPSGATITRARKSPFSHG